MQRALAFTNAQKKNDLTQKKQPYRAIEDGNTRIYPVEKTLTLEHIVSGPVSVYQVTILRGVRSECSYAEGELRARTRSAWAAAPHFHMVPSGAGGWGFGTGADGPVLH